MVAMEQALVMMVVEPASEKKVLDRLREMPGVIEAHFLYGPYDMYVKIEARTSQEIQSIVFNEIRTIPGIRSTMTCFIAD
ncbi:hypothetical protein AC482_06345 [miscellaneous Crenarchaeota group-15 archaeon DG-45]|uniref:Transcription regulator AsnC/Lrp ligand binding domain-containing protein n=1 Tax=miscellaneous Crenarchaeota group-15 archaeon DG-45 TaxID=1685127 RepID=A0A0M0BLR1_9ARCH|nr:MAG: hypothetical protein AC482_06345 [miscellaneous Crenarchaeota group-15 archaeon DG-45]